MDFQIHKAQSDDDWDFFFKLGFATLKVLRKFMYDPMVKNNPDASDEDLAKLYRKETEEYFDFSQPDARVFIAETEDGIPCGYLWMGLRNSKDAWDTETPQWIYDVVVDPSFRGHGLGRKIMQKGDEFAQEMSLNLGLFVHSENIPAIALYKKMNYRIKQTPISKKLESISSTGSKNDSLTIREEQDTDQAMIRRTELERFAKKVRFSSKVDNNTIEKLYRIHLEKFSKEQEKHQRLIAFTKDGVFAGSVWVGSSGFDEKVAAIHELVIDNTHDLQLVGKMLVDSAEKWAKNTEFSAIYMLHHAEEDIDLEFFKKRSYKIPGFFMEKQLKS